MNQTSKDVLINRAITLFNNGQIKKCLKETLSARKKYPDEPFIYNLLGVLYSQLESYEDSIKNYSKAIKLNPNYIEAITNLAIVYEIMGDFAKAEMYFNQALSLDPTNTSVLYNLANCHFNSKDYKQAIYVCQKILDLDSSFYYAYNRIGLCYIQLGDEEQAKGLFEKAIMIKPDYSEGLTNYGFILQKRKNYSLASIQFEKALSIDPDSDVAFINLSKSYFDEGRLEKAIETSKKGLSLKPKNVPLLKNLIEPLLLLNRFDEASEACKKILAIKSGDADTINMMGAILEKQGFYDEARKHFLRAIELEENFIQAKINIAALNQIQGNVEKANRIYTDLAKEHPENAEILYRKSALAIQLGNFREGWQDYEYRWKVFPMNRTTRSIEGKPSWKGERGKSVSLWREQGIGDDIIFLSLIPEVKEMCASLSVYVDPRLQLLCKRAMPEINFVKDVEELQNVECDYHLPLGSVPGLIRNDISDFDRTVTGYLKADPKRVASIRDELKLDSKTVIGISWKSFKSLNQTKKSMQLQDMEQMFRGLDVVLVNLQYGDVDNEIREFKEATGIDVVQCASVDNREDLDGLAALIEVCDIVISTSNVTVHLAGALAKETWVLQPYVAFFWWLLERTDSVWYPSLTLYRQPTLDDWESVYGSIRRDLEARLQCN